MKKQMPMLWILKKCKRRMPMLVILILSNIGSAILSVTFALGSRGVIDSAVSGEWNAFWNACVVQFSIIMGILICTTVYRYLHERLNNELDRDWKKSLLHDLLHGEYAEVAKFHSGELINRMNNDVRILNEGLVSAIPELVSMVVRLLSSAILLTAMEPTFTMLLIAAGVLVIVGTGLIRRGLKSLNKRVSECDGRVLSFIQEALEKLLVVQAMDLSDEVERRSDRLLDERYRVQSKKRRVTLAANTGVSVMFYAAGFFTLVWCSNGLLNNTMGFGTMTAMTQLIGHLQAPFVNLSGFIPKYTAMCAAAERLMEFDDIKSDAVEGEQFDAKTKLSGIGAESLSFAYDKELVLKDASFYLPRGAFVAITGASGIGKSTILKLMLGIFAPKSGELYVECDGERKKLSKNTRGLFAYVPQGNFLFSGTLRENILIGNPDADEETIAQAVSVSAMDAFLHKLPNGLDTVIGENGAGLSEGQAQRLAIARAIASGAQILLLDEITSALDGPTEELVLKRISELEDRMCIVVTHRPAALEIANYQLEVANKTIRVSEI